MAKTILCLLALLSVPMLSAQTLYAISDTNKIYRINDDYTTSFVCTVNLSGNILMDIAISPTGNFYGNTNDSIYEIDTQTGTCTFLTDFPAGGNPALGCGYDGLYSIDGNTNLLRYDLLTSEITVVAYLGFYTTGDISFYKGNLIFTTYDATINKTMIKAYNPQTGTVRDIFCDSDFFNFWGLASQHVECDDETIMVSSGSDLFTADFQSQQYILLPFQLDENESINGLASTTEYLGSECEVQDLTDLSCNNLLSTGRNLKKEITVYPNPATDVLHFINPEGITKVTIYDVAGKVVQAVSKDGLASVDISSLTQGMYMVKIESDNGAVMRKVIKR